MTESNNDDLDVAWTPHAHCLALDGVRGFAILVVTLYRICKELEPTSHPVIAAVQRLSSSGTRGVDLFFVLSGFLITGILLRSKGKPNYFRNFMARRALRIFPLYFLSLMIGLWILPNVIETNAFDMPRAEQFYLWTYLTNVRMSWLNVWCFGPFDHFWSLAVEEHFYFLLPVVVLWLPLKRLKAVCLGAIGVVAVGRTIAALHPGWATAVDVFTFFRIDSLAMGSWLAILFHESQWLHRIRRFSGIIAMITFPLLVMVALSGKRLWGIPNTLCPLFFAAAMAYLLLSARRSLSVKIFESGPLRFLGKYSYGMYVVQLPLVSLIPLSASLSWLPSNPIVHSAVYVASMFGAITCLAVLSFHLLESHFLRVKNKFES